MNAVKQGVIISFFAALFLLQSIPQLLPMHGLAMTLAMPQNVSQSLNSDHTQMSSSPSVIVAMANDTENLVTMMMSTSHSTMSENCDDHCQNMAQDCAEIMCTNLVYDDSVKSPMIAAPMRSVNFYSLTDYISLTSTSLYRPPIERLS